MQIMQAMKTKQILEDEKVMPKIKCKLYMSRNSKKVTLIKILEKRFKTVKNVKKIEK